MHSIEIWLFILNLFVSISCFATNDSFRPSDFVDLSWVDPSIQLEIRLAGAHNFIGRKLSGYTSGKCILAAKAATALKLVQADLAKDGYSLKVYDCYRPQSATDEVIRWGSDEKDAKMKTEFYPNIPKGEIFTRKFLSPQSSHSRGSAVDLTLVKLPIKAGEKFDESDKLKSCTLPARKRFGDNSIDMGTGYSCFDEAASTHNPKVGKEAAENRMRLKTAMEKHGFENNEREWWHYTLTNEVYGRTYFNFEIK